MKLLNRINLSPLRLAGHLALATALAPFVFAQEAPRSENKIPEVKVDPSPLPQVAGTITTFAPVVEKVAPSVVTISTSKMVKRGESQGQNPMLNSETWNEFVKMQGPAMQGLMGRYLEQSAQTFLNMQNQLTAQTRNLWGNFPFPGFPGAPGEAKKEGGEEPKA